MLKGSQLTEDAPWRIQVTEEDLKRLTATHVDGDWLPLKGAARALGLSQQAVLQKLNTGELEGKRVQIGRRTVWRIRLPEKTYRNQPTLFSASSQ